MENKKKQISTHVWTPDKEFNFSKGSEIILEDRYYYYKDSKLKEPFVFDLSHQYIHVNRNQGEIPNVIIWNTVLDKDRKDGIYLALKKKELNILRAMFGESNRLTERKVFWFVWGGFGLLGIFLLLFLYRANVFKIDNPIDPSIFGQFGDAVGGVVGSIWALAGIFMFYISLQQQRKDLRLSTEVLRTQKTELELQRKELKATRKVFNEQSILMKAQGEEMRGQSQIMTKEQKESTFFRLLDNHRELIGSLIINQGGVKKYQGYEVPEYLYEKWKEIVPPYKEALAAKTIAPLRVISYDPRRFVNHHLDSLLLISTDIDHIVHFVEKALDDKNFFHTTLYNTLSASEKFLFGVTYELGTLIPIQNYQKLGSYLQYYKANAQYVYQPGHEGSLPYMSFNIPNHMWDFNDRPTEESFSVLNIQNEGSESFVVKDYSFEYDEGIDGVVSGLINTHTKSDIKQKIEPAETFTINLLEIVGLDIRFSTLIKNYRQGELSNIEYREVGH